MVSGQGIEVNLQALTGYRQASDKHGEGFDKVVQKLNETRVGRESFGVMPGSGEIFSGYEERVNACVESVRECAEAMRALGDVVADCGTDYQQIDQKMAEDFGKIAQQIGEA